MKILLVDDEIIALNALKKRVDWLKYGFTEVLAAQDAAGARALLEKNRIDLLLCDIEMPGESGLELVAWVRDNHPAAECVMVTCHADFNYLKTAMKSQVSDYILKPIDYAELEALLQRFVEQRESARQRERLDKIVEQAQEDKGPPVPEGEDRIETVKRYIEEHIRERIYVEDLARLVHVNDQHLMRIFKRETGQSIMDYISEQRVLLAGNLLKNTDHSVNFIADCVGCENYSYFTKLFKRYTGLTPSEYRRQQTGADS